jgi:hypothetical protein
MRIFLQKLRHRSRRVLAHCEFLIFPATTVAVGLLANFAVSSLMNSFAPPSTIASGVFRILRFAEILYSIGSGISAIC